MRHNSVFRLLEKWIKQKRPINHLANPGDFVRPWNELSADEETNEHRIKEGREIFFLGNDEKSGLTAGSLFSFWFIRARVLVYLFWVF